MKNLSIATALLISALAGISVTRLATDAPSLSALAAPLVTTRSERVRTAGQGGDGPASIDRSVAHTRGDCRREGRTFPHGGQVADHREAGDVCEVRVLRRSGPALP